jgi:hypothetical protein
MISTSEEFYKSLGIPYRVVAIVSGALSMFPVSLLVPYRQTANLISDNAGMSGRDNCLVPC